MRHQMTALTFLRKPEIDFIGCQIHPNELHRDSIGQPIARTGALAREFMARFVEMEIIPAQLGDVQQAFDENIIQRDKKAEWYDSRDAAGEDFTDAVLHVITLEPRLYIAGGFIGASFGGRAVHAEFVPVSRFVGLAGQHRLDRAMHQQIGVAPDRLSEMSVGLIGQPEVADIIGAVDCLLQRAQHHRL